MSKYLYLYRGPATQMDTMSEEESAAQMKAWGDWIGRLGSSLVDVGNPSEPGRRSSTTAPAASPAT